MNPFKQLKQARLIPEERDHLRENLAAFVRAHPASGVSAASRYSRWSWPAMMRRSAAVGFSSLVVLVGVSGTAFAAEQALPGDTLYPVKVYVNEGVRSALTLSAKGKADLAVQLAGRRLQELEQLASKKNLKPQTSAKAVQNFVQQAQKVARSVEQLERSGDQQSALSVSAAMQVQLQTHQQILSSLEEKTEGNAEAQQELQTIEGEVKETAQHASAKILEIQGQEQHEQAAKHATKDKMDEVEHELNDHDNNSETDTQPSANAARQAARTELNDARQAFDQNDYQQAFRFAQQAGNLLRASRKHQEQKSADHVKKTH